MLAVGISLYHPNTRTRGTTQRTSRMPSRYREDEGISTKLPLVARTQRSNSKCIALVYVKKTASYQQMQTYTRRSGHAKRGTACISTTLVRSKGK